MSERKFYALGTGSQVPTRTRNQSSYFLRWDNQGFLFDAGEGTQRQMLYAGIAASDITKIFITHFHGDHCLGLPGVLQRLSLDNVQHPVEVYFPASGRQYFQNLKNTSIYFEQTDIRPMAFEKEGIIFENDRLSISTLPLDHTTACWGYRIQEKDDVRIIPEKLERFGLQGPVVGQLKKTGFVNWNGKNISLEDVSVEKPGQSFAFVTDTRVCENAGILAKEVDMLVCEATYLNEHEKEAREYGHLTAAQAAKIAQSAGAKLLLLTHFSQRYKNEEVFTKEAKPFFAKVACLSDGDVVDFPRR